MISINRFKKSKSKKASLQRPLLVFMSDGFGLLATIVDKQDDEIGIVASARSSITEPVAALAEVLGRLSVSYGKLPKESVLIHAHAIPSILELAIDNIDQIKQDKLQELIRWEMESIFADLLPRDNLGWLMIGLGYVAEAQRDALVIKLSEANSEGLDNNKKLRFGDLAISEGLINRNQLETCLKVQDQLQLQDQRIKCGWSRIQINEEMRMLSTAVSNSTHTQWVNALTEVSKKGAVGKTELKSIYPYIGSAALKFPGIYANNKTHILELHRAYLALNTYQSGVIVDSLVLACSGDTPQVGDIESLLNSADVPEGTDVYVVVTHSDRTELREALDENPTFYFKHLEREIMLPANISGDVSSSEAMMILGSTFNYLTRNNQMLVAVQGVEPPPPIYRRKEAHFAASVIIFSLIIGAMEGYMAWQIKKADDKLTKVENDVDIQQKIKRDLSKSKKLEVSIKKLEQDFEALGQLKKLMDTVLVNRNQFMDELLDMIVLNMNDNLLIDSIRERSWNVFEIQGWSLDQASVQYFSQGLTRDLLTWDMEITENPSELARDDTGFTGYSFRFVIKKLPVNTNQNTVAF